MVALDKNGEEIYASVQFNTGGERFPENNPEDIQRVVDVCNSYDDDGLTFIDMYGILKDGQDVEKWEDIEDAI